MTTPVLPVMNMLWSYVYARKTTHLDTFLGGLAPQRMRVFADSGAHSARTLGLHLDIDDYGQWLTKWHEWFTIYCNLDVIGGPEGTWRNQMHLEQRFNLHPMPVFHTGEDFDVLERYIDAGYTYIALGKLLGNSVKALQPWLAKAFRVADGRAVFHGFGMTVWRLLLEFPFYSVDSSSWGAGVRYGNMRLFHRGRWVHIRLRDLDDVKANRGVLDAYQIPYRSLTGDGYDRDMVAGACAAAMYRAARWVANVHGHVELPLGKGYPPPNQTEKVLPAQGDPGLHTYLADTATKGHQLNAAGATGFHTYLADTLAIGHQRNALGATGFHTYLATTGVVEHTRHSSGMPRASDPDEVVAPC